MQGVHMSTLDRSAIAQALAKAIAYKVCGKEDMARTWGRRLIELLQMHDILN
jgi:hypothetical protein